MNSQCAFLDSWREIPFTPPKFRSQLQQACRISTEKRSWEVGLARESSSFLAVDYLTVKLRVFP